MLPSFPTFDLIRVLLARSLYLVSCITLVQLNKWLQLEPFPDDAFRNAIMLVLVLDIVAAFMWDRLMLLVFAPKILWASVEGTTWQDAINALKVVGICYGIIYFLATVRLASCFLEVVRTNSPSFGMVAVWRPLRFCPHHFAVRSFFVIVHVLV